MASLLCLNDSATTEIDTDGHTLSLHDALPISRQRRVAAQYDLDRRREPAQFEIGIVIAGRHEEGGFAEVVLGGDCLKRRIVEPGVERHHRGRIAGEGRTREGVDLRQGDVHTRLTNQSGVTSASTRGMSVTTWP